MSARSTEFDLIQQYFSRPVVSAHLGVGDDAALLQPALGHWLAVSTDTLVCGVHFLPDADAMGLGWKALAVNLSDLAAMGATPRWTTLALTLPTVDHTWLAGFVEGFYQCAQQYGIELVGGDTTRGPLNIGVTVMGEVPVGAALRRDGAQCGDTVWVSGELGDAALALAALQGKLALSQIDQAALFARLHTPTPRLALGQALRGIATSAIDVSDGLLADLGHILQRSGMGATLNLPCIPMSDIAHTLMGQALVTTAMMTGGDDYELCFTAPPNASAAINAIGIQLGLKLTAIGRIEAGSTLQVLDQHDQAMTLSKMGYAHFAA